MGNMNKKAVLQIQRYLGLDDIYADISLNACGLLTMYEMGLLELFLDSSHNEGPSLSCLISFFKARVENGNRDKYRINGYVVNTDREDARISFNGIAGSSLNISEMQTVIDVLLNRNCAFDINLADGDFEFYWD
jgi:hypothetical protein